MPNSVVLPFTNVGPSAEQRLEEVQQALFALNGSRGTATEHVRDGDGMLTELRLTLPDDPGAAQTALDKIRENPGIVTICLNLPIPDAHGSKDLRASGPDGIVWSGTFPDASASIDSRSLASLGGGGGGSLLGNLLQAGYTDGAPDTRVGQELALRSGPTLAFTILAADTFTINYSDGEILQIDLQANIVIPGGSVLRRYYIGLDGKLYVFRDETTTQNLSFDFSAGCLGPV